MISRITRRLFSDTPGDILYHYTSFTGMTGIVGSGELRASDIRFMNDSAELRHTLELLNSHITQRIIDGTDYLKLHSQLQEWLSHRVVGGPMLFGASFRANGNLLSQWRGYSAHGKGVSLGFDPDYIQDCAARQKFEVAKCLYEPDRQRGLIADLVDAIEATAVELGEDGAERRPNQSYYNVFEHIEGDLLAIAAILKHPAFEEEQEWRLVSPAIADSRHESVHFREGWAMMVPYYRFTLVDPAVKRMRLEHVYLGPTNNVELSMSSLELYLEKMRVQPRRGVTYCQIPYRQR